MDETTYINIPIEDVKQLDCPYCNNGELNVMVAFHHGIIPSYAIECKCNTATEGWYQTISEAVEVWKAHKFREQEDN